MGHRATMESLTKLVTGAVPQRLNPTSVARRSNHRPADYRPDSSRCRQGLFPATAILQFQEGQIQAETLHAILRPSTAQNQGAAPNSGPGAMANDFGSWYDGLSAQDKAAIQGSGKGFFAYWLDLQNQAYGAATNTNMGPQGSNAAGPGGFNYAGAGLPQPNTQPYYPTSGKGPGYSPTNPGSVTQIAPPGGNNPVYTNPFLNYQTGGYGLPDASNSHTGPVAPPTTEPKPGDGSQGWTVPGGPINLPTYGDLGMTQPLAANQPGYNAPNGPVPPGGIDYGNYGGGSVTNLVKNFRGPVPPGNLPKFPGLPNRTIKTKKKNNLNQLTSFLLGY
jgi:hypothetical protein